MTLREMIAAHPDKFYPQTWYEGEAFLDTDARSDSLFLESIHVYEDGDPAESGFSAGDLAYLWLGVNREAMGRFWDYYLWTSDTDSQGQRVYVGQNGKGLEIHRHIHLTERFGVPV